jgi:signal transduction histidine kinase/ActR/RegA family two-component response regulator
MISCIGRVARRGSVGAVGPNVESSTGPDTPDDGASGVPFTEFPVTRDGPSDRRLPAFLAGALATDFRLTVSAIIYWSAATILGGLFPRLGALAVPHVANLALAGGQLAALFAFVPLRMGFRRVAQHGFLAVILATGLAIMTQSNGQQLGVVVTLILLPSFALFIGRTAMGTPWLAITLVAVILCSQGERLVGWRPMGYFPALLAGTVTAATVAAYALQWINMRAADAQREALERAQRESESASRAKSAFLAVVSHELRTPLNGILGLTESLLDRTHSPEDRDALETIRRSGDALLGLVNDILDMSKIESGHLQVTLSPYALSEVFSAVEKLYCANAAERGLTFEVVAPTDAPAWVDGDARRLRQVIYNLVSNALKFTPSGGVRVEGRWAAERLTVSVNDTGIGLAPDVRAQLFQPFFQGERGASRHTEGTGLGLAISRELVTRMGGDITVTSERGVGSTFTLEVDAPAAEAPAPATRETPLVGTLPPRVMLVEDNVVNQRVARALLTRMGVSVVVAEDGQACLDLLEGSTFDLVLMDVQMPVLDGLETTRRIRALPDARRTLPVIALTAAVFEDDKRKVIEAGMDELVAKPIRSDVLRKAMIDAYHRRRVDAA